MRLAILLILSACGPGSIAREEAQLESLTFEVPATWSRSDWKQPGMTTSQWAPQDNERKESLTIIRSERSRVMVKAPQHTLAHVLATAQQSLPEVRASKVTTIKTAKGLEGARVEVDFRPPGQDKRYRRVHVVLAEGESLVHVMYTARNPDEELSALGLVLDTIRHEEG